MTVDDYYTDSVPDIGDAPEASSGGFGSVVGFVKEAAGAVGAVGQAVQSFRSNPKDTAPPASQRAGSEKAAKEETKNNAMMIVAVSLLGLIGAVLLFKLLK